MSSCKLSGPGVCIIIIPITKPVANTPTPLNVKALPVFLIATALSLYRLSWSIFNVSRLAFCAIMLLEKEHNKNIKMIPLIEKELRFISSDLLYIKVTPCLSRS